jgi:hypothetical protein
MSPRTLAPLLVAALLLGGLAGCDDEEDLLGQSELQDCLGGKGMTIKAPDLATSSTLGNVSPDFRAVTGEGDGVNIVVLGSDQKARRAAADIRGSLQTLGAPGSEVLTQQNAIAVFEDTPLDASQKAVEECLGAGG